MGSNRQTVTQSHILSCLCSSDNVISVPILQTGHQPAGNSLDWPRWQGYTLATVSPSLLPSSSACSPFNLSRVPEWPVTPGPAPGPTQPQGLRQLLWSLAPRGCPELRPGFPAWDSQGCHQQHTWECLVGELLQAMFWELSCSVPCLATKELFVISKWARAGPRETSVASTVGNFHGGGKGPLAGLQTPSRKHCLKRTTARAPVLELLTAWLKATGHGPTSPASACCVTSSYCQTVSSWLKEATRSWLRCAELPAPPRHTCHAHTHVHTAQRHRHMSTQGPKQSSDKTREQLRWSCARTRAGDSSAQEGGQPCGRWRASMSQHKDDSPRPPPLLVLCPWVEVHGHILTVAPGSMVRASAG